MLKRMSTKELLAQSLVELGERKPVDKITIQDIADNCGVSKRTFYYHFADKYALISWIYRREIEDTVEHAGAGRGYRDFLQENIDKFVAKADYYTNAVKNTHGDDSFVKIMCDQTHEVLEGWLAGRGLEPDERAWFSIDCGIHSGIIAIIDWYRGGMQLTAETLVTWLDEDFPQCAREALFGCPDES